MFFYSALFYFLLPFILLRLLWRGIKAPAYWQRWHERFGFVSIDCHIAKGEKTKRLWLHAVSLGEVVAAQPVIEQCLKQFASAEFMLTCSTPTGLSQIESAFANNPRVRYAYAPYDLPGSVKRFLKRVQPDAFLIIETEVWPNMITQCHRQHIPILLINGRLSARSFKRYQSFPHLSQTIFSKITSIFAQAEQDAHFFKQLSAPSVTTSGSIKSDIVISDELRSQANSYRKNITKTGERTIIIAASTHRGEDELLLDVFKQLKNDRPELLCILVPRHPERFDTVAALCEKNPFSVVRKSTDEMVTINTDILLGDTIGDLLLLYGVADIAIVGGTFVDNGGHNFLEPAAWGLPLVSGLSDYNFSHIAKGLVKAQALTQVQDAKALRHTLEVLLKQKVMREEQGLAARAYVESQRGALEKIINEIRTLFFNK